MHTHTHTVRASSQKSQQEVKQANNKKRAQEDNLRGLMHHYEKIRRDSSVILAYTSVIIHDDIT